MKGLLIAMRKEYVKPVMESEEFVLNEYVAACWQINCTYTKCTNPSYIINDKTFSSADLHSGQSDHKYFSHTNASENSGKTEPEVSTAYYHTVGNYCHAVSRQSLSGRQANAS